MEQIYNNSNKGTNEQSIADMLCSAGYLPPRDIKDLERFERIYRNRVYMTESHVIDAKAIFNKVIGENSIQTIRMRPMATIFDRPGAFRVAQNSMETQEDTVSESFNQLMKDNQE